MHALMSQFLMVINIEISSSFCFAATMRYNDSSSLSCACVSQIYGTFILSPKGSIQILTNLIWGILGAAIFDWSLDHVIFSIGSFELVFQPSFPPSLRQWNSLML